MAQLSNNLFACVCLQLLLTSGLVLSSGDQGGVWTNKQCSDGHRQSPLDITSVGLKVATMKPLVFDNYGDAIPPLFSVHDFSVVLRPEEGQALPSVRGGGLRGSFVFAGLHFHWNAEGRGSEHRLEGRQFAGEMHMVHYNDKYESLAEAMKHPDGLAVFATWLEADDKYLISKNHSHSSGYMWLQGLADTYLNAVNADGDIKANLPEDIEVGPDGASFFYTPLYLGDLFPTEMNNFFRYNGSLTTNPCSETVTWTVFRSPVTVPMEFLKMLYRKKTTVRAPQPLNNRTIIYGGDMSSYYTGAASSFSGFWTLPPLLVLLKIVQ